MSNQWRNLLLSCCAASLLLGACKKKSSTDAPLPVNYNPSIIISSNNAIVYALDPVSGARNWELSLPAPVYASPLVYGNMVYIATKLHDTLYKVNAKTGEVVAKLNVDPNIDFGIFATPMADNGLIYVCGDNGGVYAMDTATGQRKWTYMVDDGSPVMASPALYKNYLYIATTGGSVYCLDKAQGGTLNVAPYAVTAPIWIMHTGDFMPLGAASFVSSPAISSPYLYVGSINDSNMYCIYLNDVSDPADNIGDLRWVYTAHNQITSSPTIYKGRCIFGCLDFNVYCLDTAIDPLNGQLVPEPIWITSTTGRVNSSPFATNQVVYTGSDDGILYALNIINGGIKWRFQTSGPILSSPLSYAGTIYVASYDKNIYAVDSVKGTRKWNFNVNGLIDCSPAIDNFTGEQVNSQISGFTN